MELNVHATSVSPRKNPQKPKIMQTSLIFQCHSIASLPKHCSRKDDNVKTQVSVYTLERYKAWKAGERREVVMTFFTLS